MFDNQGTVRDLYAYNGTAFQIGQSVTFDDFGNATASTPANAAFAAFGIYFATYKLDAATDLYNAHARWYDATTHQFTQPDPLGFAAGDPNLYRYVGNDPTNAIDPAGTESWYDWGWSLLSPGKKNSNDLIVNGGPKTIAKEMTADGKGNRAGSTIPVPNRLTIEGLGVLTMTAELTKEAGYLAVVVGIPGPEDFITAGAIELMKSRAAAKGLQLVSTTIKEGIHAGKQSFHLVDDLTNQVVSGKRAKEAAAELLTVYNDAMKVAPKSPLSKGTKILAEANIKGTGTTVLGPFRPEAVNYIKKADVKNASYFNIGDAWDKLTDAERWAANQHFLNKIADAGDQVLLSIPKGKIRPDSYLAKEVEYLTKTRGYKWTNQWSLSPGK